MKYPKEDLTSIIERFSLSLKIPTSIDPLFLLKSIAVIESSYGDDIKPRHEPAYAPGGMYFQRSKSLRADYDQWGGYVSMSYGPFQMMYPTARFYGFNALFQPTELEKPEVSGFFVVKMINEKVLKGANTIDKIADAYNSGSHADLRTQWVERYVQKFLKVYEGLKLKNEGKANV